MLQFQEYGNFADYFGPRWHYYIGDIIASIPVPFKFAKGQFESGLATKLLMEFAANPFPYLDAEADNIDVGPATDLQNDLFETSENPF